MKQVQARQVEHDTAAQQRSSRAPGKGSRSLTRYAGVAAPARSAKSAATGPKTQPTPPLDPAYEDCYVWGQIDRFADGALPSQPFAAAGPALSAASGSSGTPLPEALRGSLEKTAGQDLSSVRIHTGTASATAAEAISAKAYTTGQHIHFAAGQYDPSSKSGQELIAHEVAHTIQQRGGSTSAPQRKPRISQPGDAHEREADAFAAAFLGGAAFAVSQPGTRRVDRKAKPSGSHSSMPAAVLSKSRVTFHNTHVGRSAPLVTVAIQNKGTRGFAIENVAAVPDNAASPFRVYGVQQGQTLGPNEAVQLQLGFYPQRAETVSERLHVLTAGGVSVARVDVSGTGLALPTKATEPRERKEHKQQQRFDERRSPKPERRPQTSTAGSLHVEPEALDFGDVRVGHTTKPKKLKLTNNGATPIAVAHAFDEGDKSGPHTFIVRQPTSPMWVRPGQKDASLTVRFVPRAQGKQLSTVSISDAKRVRLSGTGRSQRWFQQQRQRNRDKGGSRREPRARLIFSRSNLVLGDVQVGRTGKTKWLTAKNVGDPEAQIKAVVGPEGHLPKDLRLSVLPVLGEKRSMQIGLALHPARAGAVRHKLTVLTGDSSQKSGDFGVSGSGFGIVSVGTIADDPKTWTADQLGDHMIGQARAALQNMQGALGVFSKVLEHPAKGDSQRRDAGLLAVGAVHNTMRKLVAKELLGALPGGGQLYEVFKTAIKIDDKIAAEKARAAKAGADSALKNFVAARLSELANSGAALESTAGNYKASIRRTLRGLRGTKAQNRFKERFFYAAESLKAKLRVGSLSQAALFTRIAREWITQGTHNGAPARIAIKLDDDWKLINAEVQAPRGNRLAEHLMKLHSGNLNLKQLGVPMVVLWYPEFNKPAKLNLNRLGHLKAHVSPDGTPRFLSTPLLDAKYGKEFRHRLLGRGIPQITKLTGTQTY